VKAARGLVLLPVLLLAACAGPKSRPQSARHGEPASEPPRATARNAPETSLPQDRRYAQNQDGEPDRKIDVATLPEPKPYEEPKSKYGNRSPYSVLGQSYDVMPSSAGYVERGLASWYGNKFHGYMTSNFETYDMYQFTAAHKTLPLPSWVRVTNLSNNKSVVVRVNDRGPFHQDRIIDLSYAAAARIGIWPAGTGMVEVRAVGPGDAEKAPPSTLVARRPAPTAAPATAPRTVAPLAATVVAAAPAATTRTPAPVAVTVTASPLPASTHDAHLYVQIGSYGDAANAQRVVTTLNHAKLGEVQATDATVNGRHLTRVRVGPLKNADEAERVVEQVQRLGLGKPSVATE